MIEAEWLSCNNPRLMLGYLESLENSASEGRYDKKLMLFSVACLRRTWPILTDERSRQLVTATLAFVEGSATMDDASAAYEAFIKAYEDNELTDGAGGSTHEAVESLAHRGARAALCVAFGAAEAVGYVAADGTPMIPGADYQEAKTNAWVAARKFEQSVQADLLRDIFGNPFRPVSIRLSSLTSPVLTLARAVYEREAFERMPELGQTLQASGCAITEILGHCFGHQAHARGCWVLDLILTGEGKGSGVEWH